MLAYVRLVHLESEILYYHFNSIYIKCNVLYLSCILNLIACNELELRGCFLFFELAASLQNKHIFHGVVYDVLVEF